MGRFEKLTHVLWHCQYHIVWVPKYRYRVLKGLIAQEVYNSIQVYCSQLGCTVVELNVQADHVHLLVKVPPKIVYIEVAGSGEGENSATDFYALPISQEKALLGQSLLGERVLRRYGRS